MRAILALGLTSVFVATTCAQVVLGNDKGKVRATNALAPISLSESPLQWSRRDFQDDTNNESFGFWPAYTIQVSGLLFDALGNQVGAGDDTGSVTITTVDSLVNNFGWPASFTVPRYLFRQGGAYTNENGSNERYSTCVTDPCGLSTNWTTATRTAGMW
jgi:hypothetical protein